jgi:hypothetical protein
MKAAAVRRPGWSSGGACDVDQPGATWAAAQPTTPSRPMAMPGRSSLRWRRTGLRKMAAALIAAAARMIDVMEASRWNSAMGRSAQPMKA